MLRKLLLCWGPLVLLMTGPAQATELMRVRIASPDNGHIHPAACFSKRGTLVVIYGSTYHTELAVSRSTDGGGTWSVPTPFPHTVGKTHYPGALTALENGQIVHAWNRWSGETNQDEPRSVLYSMSSDEGKTWGKPTQIPRDPGMNSIVRHSIVELASGEWLWSLSDRTFIYDPAERVEKPLGDGRVHGLVPIVRTPRATLISGQGLRSGDGGRNWQTIEGFPDYGVNVARRADSREGWLIPGSGYRNEMVCLSNGWLLASEILGPGRGGEKIRYVISRDDGVTWNDHFVYYNPGRPIGGRACPRTVQLDGNTIGVVFFDISPNQAGGSGLFFLRIPLSKLAN